MNRLAEMLVKNFGFEYNDFLGAITRTWKKETEVAWYGRQETSYCVAVVALPNDAARVTFIKDGRAEKTKIYSSGYARTLNAIKSTVTYAGFEF